MSDPGEVKQNYEHICHDKSIKPHTYVLHQLDLGICQIDSGGYLLNLAGNNHLLRGGPTAPRIEDEDIEVLCAVVKDSPCIHEVDLRYNNLTDKSAQHIATMLKECDSLVALNLMSNFFTKEAARLIAESLHDNGILKMLKMNGNKIGNEGGMSFAAMLQINAGLEILDLNDCDLGMESVLALATVLRQNKFITSLDVGRPLLFSVQEETTVHMGLMLRVNTVLKELHLTKYGMGDFGAERLAEGLYDNNTLKYLDLSNNRITRDGTAFLGKLLERNQTLEVLQLDQNRLECQGAMTIAHSLMKNFSLVSLSVKRNQIKGPGLCEIAECMEVNRTLEKLYVWGNVFEQDACKAIKSLLDRMRLQKENTDVVYFEADGKISLSEQSHGTRTYYYYTPLYGPESKINTMSLLHNDYSSPVVIAT